MATNTSLINRARLELGDRAMPFDEHAEADGQTTRWVLSVKPLSADTTVRVVRNDVDLPLLPGQDYTIDYEGGAVLFEEAPAEGDVIFTAGSAYRYFSDADWSEFLQTAFVEHNHGRPGVTLSRLPVVEDYPMALLAVIQALYALLNDAAFDIDISTPEGISIPRHQRYQQLQDMLTQRLMQYNLLSQALNVGLYRMEVFDLRRVSKYTGRLVPLYVEREVEDTTFPVRIFAPINLEGAELAADTVPDRDVTVVQGTDFSVDIETERDLTGYEIRVTLRKYRASSAFHYFRISNINYLTGTFTATLDSRLTYSFGGGPYWWDVRILKNGEAFSLLEGKVLVEQRPRT